jgi:hypothetical protein
MNHISLFETFKSQNEIEDLANRIVKLIADDIYEYNRKKFWDRTATKDDYKTDKSLWNTQIFLNEDYKDLKAGFNYKVNFTTGNYIILYGFDKKYNIDEMDFSYSEVNKNMIYIPVYEKNLNNKINANDFDDLKEMLNKTVIHYKIEEGTFSGDKANVAAYLNSKKYDLTLYYNKELNKELIEMCKDYRKRNLKFTSSSIYNRIFFTFYDSLIHELQHIFDGFRSMNKALKQSSEYTRLRNNAERISWKREEEMKEEEKELYNKWSKIYLNLPHEISARFTQAVRKTTFVDLEFTDDSTKYYYTEIPFKKVYRDFKRNFKGWDILTDKYKKRLTRKLSQFWHTYTEEALAKGYIS